MAKKSSRIIIGLNCMSCNSFNYVTTKNKLSTSESINIKKYCKVCRKKTQHKERKKLD